MGYNHADNYMIESVNFGGHEIKVHIDTAGDNNPDENWWGCAALVSAEDLALIRNLSSTDCDNLGMMCDWYDTTLANWDRDGDGLSCIATYGGTCEDARRWVEGSGWQCGRQTDAYADMCNSHRYTLDDDETNFWGAIIASQREARRLAMTVFYF